MPHRLLPPTHPSCGDCRVPCPASAGCTPSTWALARARARLRAFSCSPLRASCPGVSQRPALSLFALCPQHPSHGALPSEQVPVAEPRGGGSGTASPRAPGPEARPPCTHWPAPALADPRPQRPRCRARLPPWVSLGQALGTVSRADPAVGPQRGKGGPPAAPAMPWDPSAAPRDASLLRRRLTRRRWPSLRHASALNDAAESQQTGYSTFCLWGPKY